MELNTPSNIKGLSSQVAAQRLQLEGFNELPREKDKRFWNLVWDVIKEPMLLLLLICGLIYLFLGDWREAVVLLVFVILIISITIYQENKTEKALAALRNLASPRALASRDEEYQRIAGREVVREDILFLDEGDRVPADGEIVWNNNLSVNESLLTGESLPVNKGKDDYQAFSGSLIVSGQALLRVTKIGKDTEMGKIGKLLDEIEDHNTPLQNNFHLLVRNVLIISIFLCLAVVALNLLNKNGFLPSFLSGITLAMAILPEEFPVILTVFLSIGAWRMSRRQVLIRKLSAVESLGAATVLCVDKTGTLTLNQMKIEKVFLSGPGQDILNTETADNNLFRDILFLGALACRRNTFDPLEKAIKRLKRSVYKKENIYHHYTLIKEYPLSSQFLAITNAWEKEGRVLFAAKGAPEAIMSLSHLSAEEKDRVASLAKKMAQGGLRVLGIAKAESQSTSLPDKMQEIVFSFVGLLGFMDPVRPEVVAAIKECYSAGISVKIITGDYPETAKSIAQQIGLKNYQVAMVGADLSAMSVDILREKLLDINVFARMVPENKLQIISALKNQLAVVAMTGDGVNDGPALKAADIGVAMGGRGTDVAREAADIVLLDDNFSSLVKGVKEGRRIFDNLKRAMVYTLAVHIPIAGLSLLPLLFGWPPLLFPVHIVFLELIIDPVCALFFEAEPADRGIMKRQPRNSSKSILNRQNVFVSLIQGLSILAVILVAYKINLDYSFNIPAARALSFVILISANLFLILANRSWTQNIFLSLRRKNQFLIPINLFALVFLLIAVYEPLSREIFKFAYLTPVCFALAFLLGALSVTPFEIFKILFKKRLLD